MRFFLNIRNFILHLEIYIIPEESHSDSSKEFRASEILKDCEALFLDPDNAVRSAAQSRDSRSCKLQNAIIA